MSPLTNDRKIVRLRKLRKLLEQELAQHDYGSQVEYLDRCVDQLAYAQEECRLEEEAFEESL